MNSVDMIMGGILVFLFILLFLVLIFHWLFGKKAENTLEPSKQSSPAAPIRPVNNLIKNVEKAE